MTVRSGYKQTDMGVIPGDWRAEPLGDHADFITGPFGSALHKSDYVPDGIPVVNPMQIIDSKIIPTSRMSITEDAAKKLSDFRLYRGDVVIGRRGDMGRCATVQTNETGWLCGTGSMIVRTKPTLNANFAQRLLSSRPVIASIEDASVGSTMVNLNQATLKKLLIPLPVEAEQEAIAEALSDADALIESLEQLIAKKRQIKQGAMQQLLTGQKRLPGFADKWVTHSLGDVVDFLSGGTPPRDIARYWAGNIPWISASSLRCFSIFRSENNVTGEAVKAGSKMAPLESTLLLVRGSALHNEILCGLVTAPVCFNQDVKALVPHSQIFPKFLTLFIKGISDELLRLVSSAGNTAGVLDTKLLKAIRIPIPSLSEQTAIAEILSDMDAEITELETKLAKARRVKQGMMQQLLTGRIRLVEPPRQPIAEADAATI